MLSQVCSMDSTSRSHQRCLYERRGKDQKAKKNEFQIQDLTADYLDNEEQSSRTPQSIFPLILNVFVTGLNDSVAIATTNERRAITCRKISVAHPDF